MVYLAQSKSAGHLIDHPTLVREWHPTKNGRVKPEHLSANSYRKVWWQCSNDASHEWRESAHYRIRYSHCPICDPSYDRDTAVQASLLQIAQPASKSLKVAVTQQPDRVEIKTDKPRESGATTKPKSPDKPTPATLISTSLRTCAHHLVSEFHPTRNEPHNPDTIAWNSQKLIWWQCSHDASHEWKDSPYKRTQENAKGCPLCAAEAEKTPSVNPPESNLLCQAPADRFSNKPVENHSSGKLEAAPLTATHSTLLFTGVYWITGGTGTAVCTLQSPNQATIPASKILRATSYTGSHWSALLMGLQKLLEAGFRGEVVAMTDNPKTVSYMNQLLRTPNLAKSRSASDAALRVKTLIGHLEKFELRVCSSKEIQPVIGLAQSTLNAYLKSLLEDPSDLDPFPLPSVKRELESVIRPILEQPYPSDTDLDELEQAACGDEFSQASHTALSKLVPKSIAEIATKIVEAIVENNPSVLPQTITQIQACEHILRWYLRGLPISLAIRKALLFVQSQRKPNR